MDSWLQFRELDIYGPAVPQHFFGMELVEYHAWLGGDIIDDNTFNPGEVDGDAEESSADGDSGSSTEDLDEHDLFTELETEKSSLVQDVKDILAGSDWNIVLAGMVASMEARIADIDQKLRDIDEKASADLHHAGLDVDSDSSEVDQAPQLDPDFQQRLDHMRANDSCSDQGDSSDEEKRPPKKMPTGLDFAKLRLILYSLPVHHMAALADGAGIPYEACKNKNRPHRTFDQGLADHLEHRHGQRRREQQRSREQRCADSCSTGSVSRGA
jgi:hypothetical protein